MWLASNISSASGALGAEETESCICIIYFGCMLEELRVVITDLAEWMAKY